MTLTRISLHVENYEAPHRPHPPPTHLKPPNSQGCVYNKGARLLQSSLIQPGHCLHCTFYRKLFESPFVGSTIGISSQCFLCYPLRHWQYSLISMRLVAFAISLSTRSNTRGLSQHSPVVEHKKVFAGFQKENDHDDITAASVARDKFFRVQPTENGCLQCMSRQEIRRI